MDSAKLCVVERYHYYFDIFIMTEFTQCVYYIDLSKTNRENYKTHYTKGPSNKKLEKDL